MDSKNNQMFSPTENKVAEIWKEALQIDKIETDANFFEMGGDSLTTMMMLFRVGDVFDVELPPDTLMYAPTLREFCLAIDNVEFLRAAPDKEMQIRA